MLTIIDHINTSELFKKAFVKDSLNKTIEAIIRTTPTEIGCFLAKYVIL